MTRNKLIKLLIWTAQVALIMYDVALVAALVLGALATMLF